MGSCSSEDPRNNTLVVCFGEMLVDLIPTVAGLSLRDTDSFQKAAGGAPANVAAAVAKLGGNSAMVSKVGDDCFGHMLVELLSNNGVDTRGVRFDSTARTALAFITLRSDGEREFMFFRHPSADMLLTESELDSEIISRSSILHFGSVSWISEPCKSAQRCAIEKVRSSNSEALLSLDVNLRLPLWPSAEEACQEILNLSKLADIVKMSDEELRFLAGNGKPEGGEELVIDENVEELLWHPGLKLLLVTEGKAGCRYFTKKFSGRVETSKVKAVDSTGAGDAFMGGFLFKLSGNMKLYEDESLLREAVEFANACGALATTGKGAVPSLPCHESVLNLIRQTRSPVPDLTA